MANRTLLGSRRAPVLRIARESDGTVSPYELDRQMDLLNAVLPALLGGISLGSGESSSIAGNFRGQIIDWVFSATPNSLETIPHGLGVVPVAVIPLIKDRAGDIYDTTFRAGWGPSQIQLYCSVASVKVKLLVLS